MGRGNLPVSEVINTALETLGREIVDAVARGEFERARELTEAAIQLRTTEPFLSEENLLPKRPLPSNS